MSIDEKGNIENERQLEWNMIVGLGQVKRDTREVILDVFLKCWAVEIYVTVTIWHKHTQQRQVAAHERRLLSFGRL